MSALPVLVMGAGAIGCFVGGRLAAAGASVHFVGRPRVLEALRQHGLVLSDVEAPGREQRLPAQALQLNEHVRAGLAPALVLLCVKSAATEAAAAELAQALPAGTPVLSLQNGISNPARAQKVAPGLRLLAGMVPFNVVESSPGHYRRTTGGQLAAQDDPALRPLQPLFEAAGLPLQCHTQMLGVQWGKLLLNLNNPVNALSGLPLRRQLLDRDHRRVVAALQEEALGLMSAAGIEPAQVTAVPPRWMPRVLRLPSWLFRRVAARSLKIDDQARSSMADDLRLGRVPEVDALCGEVQRLAERLGREAPLNRRIAELMLQAQPGDAPRSGRALQQALGLA